MQLCFYLLLVLHVAEGCSLEERGQTTRITAYKGGSVLLPCYCTELRAKPERITWWKDTGTWEEISTESDQYRDRVQLFNSHSPGNLSLLISHLTEEDGGGYRCDVGGSGHRVISLTVEGCRLENHGKTTEITAYTGESVLLPCYCTDTNSKPETFTWKKDYLNGYMWGVVSNESGQYRGRVQLFYSHSPGNLSLLISHLTEEDGGVYRCRADESRFIDISEAGGSGFTDISLTAKGKPSLINIHNVMMMSELHLSSLVSTVVLGTANLQPPL
ncbi:polymeric immunoglobulin receptor-like [Hoplias malabaricus]|uniref:polymeric immunoglobulin receptor-like n=1 Tax=Hoplias malabaricus TaxID=27720 RepID=UPI003462F307